LSRREEANEGEEVSDSIYVPVTFKYAPFYTGNDTVSYNIEHVMTENPYFLYDMAYVQQVELRRPWENRFVYIQEIIAAWKVIKEEVGELFRKRNRNGAKPLMLAYIAHLLSALFWLNEKHVPGVENIFVFISELSIKPLNVEERLQFMLESPDHYHSFIQLCQLYEEMEKLTVKQQILTKRAHKS
jgi:hypothetical protein